MEEHQWYILTTDYTQLTVSDRNAIVYRMRQLIEQTNSIEISDIWTLLEAGSLIVKAEFGPKFQIVIWPDSHEVMEAIAQVAKPPSDHKMTGQAQRTPTRPTGTWADAQYCANEVDDSRITHNPQGIGFRLVTEKSLTLKTLRGEQDPRNKIPYNKWS